MSLSPQGPGILSNSYPSFFTHIHTRQALQFFMYAVLGREPLRFTRNSCTNLRRYHLFKIFESGVARYTSYYYARSCRHLILRAASSIVSSSQCRKLSRNNRFPSFAFCIRNAKSRLSIFLICVRRDSPLCPFSFRFNC